MYREGLKTARERLDQARARVAEREARLSSGQLASLPRRLRKRLATILPKTEPTADTVDAITTAEQALEEYDDWLTAAFDVLAQTDGKTGWRAWLPGRRRGLMRSVLPLRLAIIAAVVAAALLIALAPQWLVESASDEARRCFDKRDKTGEGDPSDCHQRLRLLWPVAIPWSRRAALAQWRAIGRRVAVGELDVATAAEPNARARAKAAVAVLAGATDELEARRSVAGVGAWSAIASRPPLVGDVTALRAAAAMGDLQRVRTLANFEDRGASSQQANLIRGAWLCRLGDREAGIAALVRADRHGPTNKLVGDDRARLAIVACGGGQATLGFDPTTVHTSWIGGSMLALRLADPNWQRGRRLAQFDSLAQWNEVCFAAGAISSWDFELWDLLGLLSTESQRPLPEHVALSPDRLLAPRAVRCPAEWLETAAQRLAAKIATSPPRLEPDEDRELTLGREKQPHRSALAAPAETLRQGAWTFWALAANARARWGQLDQARADLSQAIPLAGADRWRLAGPALVVGDGPRALKLLAPLLADYEDTPLYLVVAAQMNQARALAQQGRFEAAHHAAEIAHRLARRHVKGWCTIGTAAWLHAALALKIGAKGELPGLPDQISDTRPRLECGDLEDSLTFWWDLAVARLPVERRARRLLAPSIDLDPSARTELTAMMFVVGEAVEGDGEVEVWLDRIFAELHLSGDSRAPRARAEAARWRGDEDAARQWDERTHQLTALVQDYPSEVLATAVTRRANQR